MVSKKSEVQSAHNSLLWDLVFLHTSLTDKTKTWLAFKQSVCAVCVYRIGSNEPMGSCWFGSHAPEAGRCHWQQMLDAVRKPVAQWHRLCDVNTADKQLRRVSTMDSASSLPPTPSSSSTSPIPLAGPFEARLSVDSSNTHTTYSTLIGRRFSHAH